MATFQEVVNRARYVLADVTAGRYRWSDAEFLVWCNDAVRETIVVKPDANYTVTTDQMDAGALQELPAAAVALIDIPCNMGTDGSTPGRAIIREERRRLDAVLPDWPAEDQVAEIKNWMFDPSQPRNWLAWPPSDGTGYVRIIYSTLPAAAGALSGAFPLTDLYIGPVVHYLLYRALSKDVDFAVAAGGASRAMGELAVMYQMLGRQDLVEAMTGFGGGSAAAGVQKQG